MDITLDILLIVHFVGLMMGAGGGLGSTVAMGYAAKLPPEQAGVIRGLGPILARVSAGGLALMLVTGVSLVILKYGGFTGLPVFFWVKLVFVATLTIAVIIIEMTYARVKKGDFKAAAILPRIGPMAGISSLLAVIFAALAFH